MRLLLRFSLLAVLAAPLLRADDEPTAASLAKIYSDWRTALVDHNMKAWQNCTSNYRQVTTRNLIVSQKGRYPDAIFDLPVKPPEVYKLKLVEFEAVGETAHLLYYGKVDLGLDSDVKEIPSNLLMLKFFKEKGGWKFDSSKFFNLGDNPQMRAACESGNPEFVKDPPFNPPGKAPAVPKLCAEPDRVAALRIQAIGYEVMPTLNGYEGTLVSDAAEQQLIIGGLARGSNSLKLKITEIELPAGEEHYIQVEAVLLPTDGKSSSVRVFNWVPDTQPPPAGVDLDVVLNNLTMKGI